MFAKVISTDESIIYKDKIYGYGDEFEINDAVGKSLIERGLIVGITDDENLFPEDEVADGDEILEAIEMREDIDEMSYPELKSYASKLGLSANGKKDELIKRIKEHFEKFTEAETENGDDDEGETDNENGDEIPNTSMPE